MYFHANIYYWKETKRNMWAGGALMWWGEKASEKGKHRLECKKANLNIPRRVLFVVSCFIAKGIFMAVSSALATWLAERDRREVLNFSLTVRGHHSLARRATDQVLWNVLLILEVGELSEMRKPLGCTCETFLPFILVSLVVECNKRSTTDHCASTKITLMASLFS